MVNKVEVIIKPVTLRFTYYQGDVYYHFSAGYEAPLDKIELALGVDPKKCQSMLDSGIGFLPVASTVLITGEKNIIVDPGIHHIGGYGILAKALADKGLTFDDIDCVVATHSHHDHFYNVKFFSKELVLGSGELEAAYAGYGKGDIDAKISQYSKITEVSHEYEICKGVKVLFTPGHSPGSVSIIVETGEEKVAVVGDTIMFREEYETGKFSHWYTEEQLKGIKNSVEEIMKYAPDRIIPGHDREFSV